MAHDETRVNSELELPTVRRTVRLFGRAFRLRCPNCGQGPVLHHWLKLRVRCGSCGLRLQRGEHDYFVGSVFILFTLAGLLIYAVLAATLIATGPAVPWDLLEYGLPVLMAVSLVALFPFSRLVWLAFDLMLRPVTPQELEWHRETPDEWSSVRDAGRD
jgi:uncharacterized protein (DUF983 family)